MNFFLFFLVLMISVGAFPAEITNCGGVFSSEATEIQEILSDIEQLNQLYNPKSTPSIYQNTNSSILRNYKIMDSFFKMKESDLELSQEDSLAFWAIIKKIILHPEQKILTSEARILRTNTATRNIFRSSIFALGFLKVNFWPISKVLQYGSGAKKPITFFKQSGYLKKTSAILKALYNGPFRFLSSFLLPRIQSPVDKIFEKQFFSGKELYIPTDAEISLLQRFGVMEQYYQQQEFTRKKLTWNTFRKWMGVAALTSYLLVQTAIVNYSLIALNAAPVSVQQYTTMYPAFENQYQVRILNETTPFPHSAIQMGGKVYSYGQTHITNSPVSQYLYAGEIAEILKLQGNEEPEGSWNKSSFAVATPVKDLLDKLGPRSVQVIEVNLNEQAYRKLQRMLETSTAKKYRNSTFVVDCMTMIKYALSESAGIYIPPMIDASPGMSGVYLAFLKRLGLKTEDGRPLVGNIFQVTADDQKNFSYEEILSRNAVITNIENNLMVGLLPITIPHRMFKELVYGEEDMQYWQPKLYEVMTEIGLNAIEKYKKEYAGVQLNAYKKGLSTLSISSDSEDSKKRAEIFLNKFDNFYLTEIKRLDERILSANSSFLPMLEASFQKHYLNIKYRNIKNGNFEETELSEFSKHDFLEKSLLELK